MDCTYNVIYDGLCYRMVPQLSGHWDPPALTSAIIILGSFFAMLWHVLADKVTDQPPPYRDMVRDRWLRERCRSSIDDAVFQELWSSNRSYAKAKVRISLPELQPRP